MLGAALSLLFQPAAAQQDPFADKTFQRISSELSPAYGKGDYLAALAIFGDPDAIAADSPARSIWQQFRPSLDGFVADRDIPRSRRDPLTAEVAARFAALERREAIAAIVEHAARTRIVIINEAHDNPRDRAFVMDVAEALRPLGYTHYAAEALTNCCYSPEQAKAPIDAVRQRDYAAFGDGYYLADPAFAYLLHRVLVAGYEPVAYEYVPQAGERPENPNESIALREAAQARNLAAALEAAGPDAKFLIHVGYSHAAERPFSKEQEWMASRLKALTGIDPLTINQTDLSEYNMPQEYAAIGMEQGTAPVVIFEGGEPAHVGFNAELMDLQVVHPPIAVLGGRPDWLARTGRVAFQLGADMVPDEGVRLVQVFLAQSGADAVPIDQVLIRPGDEPPVLYVPRDSQYRIVTQQG
ncbi:hypothetical protein GCM10009127_11990 [Alteraurantiacibacter aestuarii]